MKKTYTVVEKTPLDSGESNFSQWRIKNVTVIDSLSARDALADLLRIPVERVQRTLQEGEWLVKWTYGGHECECFYKLTESRGD